MSSCAEFEVIGVRNPTAQSQIQRWKYRTAHRLAALGIPLLMCCPVQAKSFSCSAGDVQCLVASVREANTNGHRQNTIRLDAGTYALTNVDNEVDGRNGLPSITSTVRIVGAGANITTIVRSSSAAAFRLIHVGANGNLTLDGVSLNGGRWVPAPGGGGLYNDGGDVTITNAELFGNFSDFGGGGIFNDAGRLIIDRSEITENMSIHGGAGVYNNHGRVSVTESTFARNTSDGGTFSTFNGTVQIARSRFIENVGATHVAGLSASGGAVDITRSTFDGNTGFFGGGGAINIAGGARLELSDSALTDNSTRPGGGFQSPGILLASGSTAVITNTTFARNALLSGPGPGHGIAVHNLSGRLSLINSTVADNYSEMSHGINSALFSGPDAITILTNTIIANNTSSDFNEDCAGPVTSLGYNIVGSITGCAVILQPSDFIGDAGLGPFRDNGNAGNGHFPLLATSSAINAANNRTCPKTDQIGQRRKPNCDIGAIEFSLRRQFEPAFPIFTRRHDDFVGGRSVEFILSWLESGVHSTLP